MKRFFPWVGAAAILVIIFGTIYGVVQQALRRDANSPQIQIAEDAATALNGGAQPAQLIKGKVSLNTSLASFTAIYSKSGQIVAGSGYLHGSVPRIPYGVLTAARGKPYHFVTWQPESDVRIAAVTVAADNYYVLSGRSLTEVEKNETRTFQLALLGGLASLTVLAITFLLTRSQVR